MFEIIPTLFQVFGYPWILALKILNKSKEQKKAEKIRYINLSIATMDEDNW
jgi:hypothetical protein